MTLPRPRELAPFSSYLPVRISFGDGVAGELADVLETLGASSALVLLEEPVAAIDGVAAALAACEARGIAVHRHAQAAGRADVRGGRGGRARDRSGSSPARSSRSAVARRSISRRPRACVAEQGGPLTRFAGGATRSSRPRLPLVTIPTTSGTGSEVSGGAVMTDKAAGRKVGLASPNMRAQYALVDPLLTVGLPPAPTAQTGVDALAQAIGGVDRDERQPALDRGGARGLSARRRLARARRSPTDRTSRHGAA